MRLAMEWLSEWIDLPEPAELTERLDMGGFEDARVEDTGPDLSAVVVGQVVDRQPHPNADRLSCCRVDVGDGEPLEIVCGAPNVAQGQKVAVARVGTTLPDGTKLKKTKIRGVASDGMICSTRELGLGDEHDGILVLDASARVGAGLPEVMVSGERILEVGITPNRGDTASLLGVAREVRALCGGEIREPETAPPESGANASEAISVSIECAADCHHYVARIVRGVSIGPSPDWMARRLEVAGIRSINNLVDITNYVLLEFGQPLHAFDLASLRGAEIRVRRATPGEKLATLDGETRELSADDMVIADAERAIALAGVMGGRETEVAGATTDVLIESAHFHPISVRLTARRHGLRSEATYRFERGVDRQGIVRAADRCARLMAELAGGLVAPGTVEARGEPPQTTSEIRLEAARANRLLGTEFDPAEICTLLGRAGIEASEVEPGVIGGRVPSYRNDLHLHQDLTEEVARIFGYDRIPTSMPAGLLSPIEPSVMPTLADASRDALVAAGLLETVSFPFVAPAEMEGLRLPEGDPLARTVEVVNPIKEEEPRLRSLLAPTLLRLVRQNLSRQADRVRIFEVSRVFRPGKARDLPQEPLQAGVALADADPLLPWGKNTAPLFFQAKGIAERLLNQLGYVAALQRTGVPPYLHPGASAAIEVGGQVIGSVGELHPETAARFEIEVPCALVEVDLSRLGALPRREPQYREVSRFPQSRRDLAVLVGRQHAAGDLRQAIQQAAGNDCVSTELFDRYEGKGVPEAKVSLAFRLVFQRSDRTLKDSEVTKAVDRVVRMLSRRFEAELR